MLEYIILIVAAIVGVALFVFEDALSTLLPRRVAYTLLAFILIGLAIFLSLRR
jgi:hypothetical protein